VVRRNPQYKDVTDADLRAQYALAIKVRDKVSEANNGVVQSRGIKREAGDRMKKSEDAKLKATGDTLVAHLKRRRGRHLSVKNQSGQDPLNFPIRINNRLANLNRVVNTGDGRPIANAPVLLNEYSKLLSVQIVRLDKVVAVDLAAFNAELKRLGLEQINGKCPGSRFAAWFHSGS